MEPKIDVSSTEGPRTTEDTIVLSRLAHSLIREFARIKAKPLPDDVSKISVSQTVSFFALAYEKIRNAVEYRDASLIRRAAIQRIIVRRLGMNPSGRGEAENVIRELLWARYFPNESLVPISVFNAPPYLRNRRIAPARPCQTPIYKHFFCVPSA